MTYMITSIHSFKFTTEGFILCVCLSAFSFNLQYNFEGNYDIVRFFKEIQNAGMHAILRIGPYICGEWNYGYISHYFSSLLLEKW